MIWVLFAKAQDLVLMPEVPVRPVGRAGAVVEDLAFLLEFFGGGESGRGVAGVCGLVRKTASTCLRG